MAKSHNVAQRNLFLMLGFIFISFCFLAYQVYKLVHTDVTFTPAAVGQTSSVNFVLPNKVKELLAHYKVKQQQWSIAEAEQKVAEIRQQIHRS